MNAHMNQPMNPSMNPSMNAPMNQSSNSAMNPELNPPMNSAANPPMNQTTMNSAMNPAMNTGANHRICVCGLIPYEYGTLMIGPPMLGAEGGHQHRSMYARSTNSCLLTEMCRRKCWRRCGC